MVHEYETRLDPKIHLKTLQWEVSSETIDAHVYLQSRLIPIYKWLCVELRTYTRFSLAEANPHKLHQVHRSTMMNHQICTASDLFLHKFHHDCKRKLPLLVQRYLGIRIKTKKKWSAVCNLHIRQ